MQDVHKVTDEIVIDGDLSEWNFPKITDPLIGIPKIGRDDRVDGDPQMSSLFTKSLAAPGAVPRISPVRPSWRGARMASISAYW